MHDNGMLNSVFLRKCRKIGHIAEVDVLRDMRLKDVEFPNIAGMVLPYSALSSSERWWADKKTLFTLGYCHQISFDRLGKDPARRDDRATVQIFLDQDIVMEPWTHAYSIKFDSIFFFTDEMDALRFRLSIQ
jgi:hypothetical protein